jgi:hypothetical protein
MKTKTHFAFRVYIWDDAGECIVEHFAGTDDFQVAEETYRAPIARWPTARLTLRPRVVHESGQRMRVQNPRAGLFMRAFRKSPNE